MGLEAILAVVLPIILRGLASAFESYEQGKIDQAQLKAQVASVMDEGKARAAALMSNFSDEHIEAFVARLHAASRSSG